MINQGYVLVITEKLQERKKKRLNLLNQEMDGERSALGTDH